MTELLGFEKGLDKIEKYLKDEMASGGLLEDIEDIFIGIGTEPRPDPPYLWITEEPTVEDTTRPNPRGDYLLSPFVISGVCYDPDDILQSYKDSKNLVTRAGKAIEKGHHKDQNKWFRFVDFKDMNPEGAEIVEASTRVSQATTTYNCVFIKSKLCQKMNKGE